MAKFQPGQSGNPAGRPPGSKNVLTKTIRKRLKAVIDSQIEEMPGLLDDLPARDRLDVIVKLMKYVLPPVTPVPPSSGEPFDMEDFSTL